LTNARPRIRHARWAAALGTALALATSVPAIGKQEPPHKGAPGIAPVPHVSSADIKPAPLPDPYPSTYRPATAAPFAIVGANIFDGEGHLFEGGTVLVENNKIKAAGRDVTVPVGWQVIDGHGKWVTPGVIDAHSHMSGLRRPRCAGPCRWQRECRAQHLAGLGRAFDLAAGSLF
jgi:hypothetical protein